MDTMLKLERKKRGWSQTYVAERAGISRQAIRLLETGATKPSYEVMLRLLDLFGVVDPRKLF